MKKILLMYIFIALIMVAVLSVLSYNAGVGYVYVLWYGVQVQSNIWVLVFTALTMSFMLHLSWIAFRFYLSRQQRKLQHVLSFDALHPYEQLGVVWILQEAEEQQTFIQQVFNQSGLLKQIVQARLLFKQKKYAQALVILDASPAATFELAEIQRIEIYLAQKDVMQALTHLEFLNGHQMSPWLIQVNLTYQHRIFELWAEFALLAPWLFLHATTSPSLEKTAMQAWLVQLLSQFEQAQSDDLTRLKQKYLENLAIIQKMPFETQVLWLKVLTRLEQMSSSQEELALHLLELRFDQDVFYLWFQQQLLKEHTDYISIENYIRQLEGRYPSMPVLSFAQWHIYSATQRFLEAEQLLTRYPDNILMNYLRIKSTLTGQDDLLRQLNLVFENDVKFLQFKI
ncbi:hypothetical protein EC844_101380 [Acinetobacter calcoaceticus]|uniref:Heme biosynthesis protein HemY n=1 Tax=Acinetobacter calcoaceticus TaxID=471 RepID=A0A4R1YA78_ACICA|nr:hypothetical protein EC844_101380 [Acinetobacter calcoaceticus]